MSRPPATVVMLTRFPRLGEAKTRIGAILGDEAAKDLHDRMARHTLRALMALQVCGEARAEVRTDAAFSGVVREWLGKGPGIRYQGEGDLGRKITLAFANNFGPRVEKVVVVGSDCPSMDARHLREALAALDAVDCVLGPATDGGYYLVGLRRSASKRALGPLFAEMPWGSTDVLVQTLHAARKAGVTVSQLEELSDVDLPEDVPAAEALLGAAEIRPDSPVSVVVPALDDEQLVGAAVRSALLGGAAEVIVADGGSQDATQRAAREAGARVIDAPRGRGSQMNAGAAAATGDVVCFLHADTVLPHGWAAVVREVLARDGVVAAAFDFAVPASARFSATIAMGGMARWRLTGTPYGDQAICVPHAVWEALGGFPDIPVMEDLEFARRLKRFGRIGRVALPAVTSARVWEQHGLALPTVVNAAGIAAYRAGVSPGRIAGWRRRISAR